jgi:hypothetical protein
MNWWDTTDGTRANGKHDDQDGERSVSAWMVDADDHGATLYSDAGHWSNDGSRLVEISTKLVLLPDGPAVVTSRGPSGLAAAVCNTWWDGKSLDAIAGDLIRPWQRTPPGEWEVLVCGFSVARNRGVAFLLTGSESMAPAGPLAPGIFELPSGVTANPAVVPVIEGANADETASQWFSALRGRTPIAGWIERVSATKDGLSPATTVLTFPDVIGTVQ